MMANAGKRGGKYSGFKDFTKRELLAYLGVYLLHSISPSPQIEMKFKCHAEDPVNGSDTAIVYLVNKVLLDTKNLKLFLRVLTP